MLVVLPTWHLMHVQVVVKGFYFPPNTQVFGSVGTSTATRCSCIVKAEAINIFTSPFMKWDRQLPLTCGNC